jgi:hypothetical protein
MRPRHAEDTVADPQAVFSGRDSFGHAGEVNAHHKRIRRGRRQPSQQIAVQRVDSCEPHPDEHRAVVGWNGQVLNRRSLTKALNGECPHVYLPASDKHAATGNLVASDEIPRPRGGRLPPVTGGRA